MTSAFLVVVPPVLAGLPTRPATVSGHLWIVGRRVPALVPGPGARVHGVLVELPDPRMLGILDAYAGEDAVRVEVDARAGLRTVGAWAWAATPEHAKSGRPVPSGRWPPGAPVRR